MAADTGMDGNSLVSALAGDAAQVGTAYFAAQGASAIAKANPGSLNTLIYVGGGILLLVGVVFLLKK